jgi:hypothetical protein
VHTGRDRRGSARAAAAADGELADSSSILRRSWSSAFASRRLADTDADAGSSLSRPSRRRTGLDRQGSARAAAAADGEPADLGSILRHSWPSAFASAGWRTPAASDRVASCPG